MVDSLSAVARRQGLSDSAWARLAALPKESLSRLRRRENCDWMTLQRLAGALELQLAATAAADSSDLTPDGHLPLTLTRDDEDRLQQFILAGDLAPSLWRAYGPAFFMAGLAVLLASSRGFDRTRLLDLAEALHPGMSDAAVFNLWLQRAPLEPSRFFAQLEQERAHAARP
jgi:hypothetical protein